MQRNPTYVSNLNALTRVDRLRKKEGNWNVTEAEGMFEAGWFKITENIPKNMRLVRYWDRAATEVTKKNPDPDWTAGVLCGKHDGILYILDVQHFREGPGENERKIKQTAEIDGKQVQIGLEQEPGSSGKDVIHHYITKVLNGYWVTADLPTGDKIVRAKQWCGLAEHGYVCLKKAPWNHSFINEAASFPHGKKDQIDGTSGANKLLVTSGIGFTSSSQVAREDAERERAERQAAA
jgi:predicted phage terminase large subunit-like protein